MRDSGQTRVHAITLGFEEFDDSRWDETAATRQGRARLGAERAAAGAAPKNSFAIQMRARLGDVARERLASRAWARRVMTHLEGER